MQRSRLAAARQRRDLQTRMELAFPWVKLVARWTQPEKIKPDQLPREAELAHPAILPCIMAPMRSRYQAPDFRAARSRLANAVIRDFARLRPDSRDPFHSRRECTRTGSPRRAGRCGPNSRSPIR